MLSKTLKRAIETFGQDLCVRAGAGSGKTTLLVERFLYALLKKKAAPGQILAITFTEKAAHEMKLRLVRACTRRGEERLRRELEDAYISTIHGFCARVLKENPIESGVDPFFRILSQGESDLLTDEVLDRVMNEEPPDGPWLRMLCDYGEEAVRQSLKNLEAAMRARALDERFFERPHDAFTEKERFRAELSKEIKLLAGQIHSGRATEAERVLAKNLEHLGAELETTERGWTMICRVTEAANALTRRIKKYKDPVEALSRKLKCWAALVVQELAEPLKLEWIRMFGVFRSALEAEKRRRAAYDFDDLLFKTYELLSGGSVLQKAVRDRYREKFRFIFVDEFQDTSPLESRVIELLKREGNLFIVGDIQQSIYSFRYADPRVFRQWESRPGVRKMFLSENYRSRPEVLHFVNGLFGALWRDDFHALKAMKKFAIRQEPSVELLEVPEDDSALDRRRVAEARALAHRIRQLVDTGRYRPKDIAILLRSTTASRIYERELLQCGVRFVVSKGRGFYEKTEVTDILSFLKLVENPYLDIALAAVLRSPLAAVSDDALFWLAHEAKVSDAQEPLYGVLQNADRIRELSDDDRQKLRCFYAMLQDFQDRKNRLPVSGLIERLLAETQYEAKILGEEEGLQKAANVRKLVEMARALESHALTGVDGFLRYLRAFSEREVLEPEASLKSEAGDVLQILTVHAAKGLEFPCVAVADMGQDLSRNSRHSWILAEAPWGLSMKLKSPVDFSGWADAGFTRIAQVQAQKEAEEEKRLLYVAMTRAQDRLILSGCENRNSWMEWVKKAWPDDVEPYRIPVAGGPVGARSATSAILPADLRREPIAPLILKDYPEKWNVAVTRLSDHEFLPEIEEELAPSRREFGTVFHRVMEFCVKKNRSSHPFLKDLTRDLSAAEKEKLQSSLQKFWTGSWGKAARGAIHRYAELPFVYKTPYGVLKGQMDLLFQTRQGEWVILDYKTGAVTPEAHRFQLDVYALIFRRLYDAVPKKGVLYFTLNGEAVEFLYDERRLAEIEQKLHAVLSSGLQERFALQK